MTVTWSHTIDKNFCFSTTESYFYVNFKIKSKNEHDWTQKQFQYYKVLPTFYFAYFRQVWPLPSKTIQPNCKNFDAYLHAKIWNLTLTSFLRYCKDIPQTCYFEYLENAWSCSSFMIVSPYRKFWCPKCWNLWERLMFICMQENQLHFYFLFWDIAKTLQILYFVDFGNAWPFTSKIIVPDYNTPKL